MLNKISYLSKSATIVFAVLFVGMIQNSQQLVFQPNIGPGPHGDCILLESFMN